MLAVARNDDYLLALLKQGFDGLGDRLDDMKSSTEEFRDDVKARLESIEKAAAEARRDVEAKHIENKQKTMDIELRQIRTDKKVDRMYFAFQVASGGMAFIGGLLWFCKDLIVEWLKKYLFN